MFSVHFRLRGDSKSYVTPRIRVIENGNYSWRIKSRRSKPYLFRIQSPISLSVNFEWAYQTIDLQTHHQRITQLSAIENTHFILENLIPSFSIENLISPQNVWQMKERKGQFTSRDIGIQSSVAYRKHSGFTLNINRQSTQPNDLFVYFVFGISAQTLYCAICSIGIVAAVAVNKWSHANWTLESARTHCAMPFTAALIST